MRLDELDFREKSAIGDATSYADAGGDSTYGGVRIRVWALSSGGYRIRHFTGPHDSDVLEWDGLDALTAQAVLFDLCSRSDP